MPSTPPLYCGRLSLPRDLFCGADPDPVLPRAIAIHEGAHRWRVTLEYGLPSTRSLKRIDLDGGHRLGLEEGTHRLYYVDLPKMREDRLRDVADRLSRLAASLSSPAGRGELSHQQAALTHAARHLAATL